MVFSDIVLCIFIYMHVVNANDSKLSTEALGFSETSICENSTADCFSEQITYPVPLYVSDSSTEHSTVSDVVTEATAMLTTTTSTLPTPNENKLDDNSLIEKPCNCDTSAGLCNINCCCDMDCNKWERDAFSECIAAKPMPTVGHCISTGIIYKNNTAYPIVRSEDGFFCISKDNFPERNWYLEQGIIKSDRIFEKVWRRKRHFYWKMYYPPQFIKFMKKDIYKYGDPIWKYLSSTNTVQELSFPAPLASSMCGQEKTILYLENFKSNCLESIPMTEEQCLNEARKFYQSKFLIATPSLINNTYNVYESPDEAFVNVKYELCNENECSLVDSYPVPEFNPATYICKNIVKSLDLQVRHNGSRGITSTRCRITLTSTGPEQPLFQRTFSVEFLPVQLPNVSVLFKRSGTPGYRVGLPVITGFLQGDHVVKKRYLTVASGINCSESTEVLFGENSRTQCLIQIPVESTRNCTRLREEIAKLLVMQMTGDMIGTSGDPDTWLKRPMPIVDYPGLLMSHQPCSVPSSLTLDFLYSYSGSLWQPKANIIGVSSALVGQRIVDCSTSIFVCSLRLVSVISFTDVSQPALSKFATPPVVKIKLPRDFFYPFSSSTSCPPIHGKRQLLIIFMFFWCIISHL